MTQKAVELFAMVFAACVDWADSLFNAVQGKGFLIAGIIIVFITSLFLMPLRGGSVAISSSITDFASSSIYKGKYWNGKWTVGDPNYKGKFERSNSSSRTVRRGSYSRYYAGGSGKQGI